MRLSIPLPENPNPVQRTGDRGLKQHGRQRSQSPDDGIHLALLDIHGVLQEQGRLVRLDALELSGVGALKVELHHTLVA